MGMVARDQRLGGLGILDDRTDLFREQIAHEAVAFEVSSLVGPELAYADDEIAGRPDLFEPLAALGFVSCQLMSVCRGSGTPVIDQRASLR